MKTSQPVFRRSLIVFLLTIITSVFATIEEVNPVDDDQDPSMEKRLYDFGLGKRAYRYVSEYKRLPKYDFGLGKRSRVYSFGLGKRSNWDDGYEYDHYLDDGERVPETEMYDDDEMQSAEKRSKMYSFGLGKRRPLYEFGLGKRARQYSFGLGKRERLYSFGLGKKNDRMYSFGLGKRDQVDYSNLDKREVSPNELKAVLKDSQEDSKENSTSPIDSHEIMGHGDRQIVAKRSPRQYSFGLGKRDEIEEDLPESFSRQYRKPSYSFGLGKRRQMYSFGLGKRNYQV